MVVGPSIVGDEIAGPAAAVDCRGPSCSISACLAEAGVSPSAPLMLDEMGPRRLNAGVGVLYISSVELSLFSEAEVCLGTTALRIPFGGFAILCVKDF